MELPGHIILVSGASRGIGAAVAEACARAGATVVLCARDVRALERLADRIEAAGGAAPVLAPINLEAAGGEDYGLIAQLVGERYGRLDGLVVNAAMLGELAPLASYDALTWARVFQVNLHSGFLLLQACLPVLLAAPAPALVFSLAADDTPARPYWGAYAVSKRAQAALFEVLAAEHAGSALRVNAVLPEPVATRLRRAAYPALDPATLAAPESVADAYVALLGARGRAVHGRRVAVLEGRFSL